MTIVVHLEYFVSKSLLWHNNERHIIDANATFFDIFLIVVYEHNDVVKLAPLYDVRLCQKMCLFLFRKGTQTCEELKHVNVYLMVDNLQRKVVYAAMWLIPNKFSLVDDVEVPMTEHSEEDEQVEIVDKEMETVVGYLCDREGKFGSKENVQRKCELVNENVSATVGGGVKIAGEGWQ